MPSTLASLAASVALIGTVVSLPDTPTTQPLAPAAGPAVVARVPLARISAAQSKAVLSADLGGLPLTARASFDSNATLWVRLSRGAWSGAYDETTLIRGLEATTPEGPLRLQFDAAGLHVTTASGASAVFVKQALLDRLYNAALRRKFVLVTYALLYEDGAGTPASLCLLRRNEKGDYFVSYQTLAEMANVQWFLGVNMVLYGMKIEACELVFVSKPVPPEMQAFTFFEPGRVRALTGP